MSQRGFKRSPLWPERQGLVQVQVVVTRQERRELDSCDGCVRVELVGVAALRHVVLSSPRDRISEELPRRHIPTRRSGHHGLIRRAPNPTNPAQPSPPGGCFAFRPPTNQPTRHQNAQVPNSDEESGTFVHWKSALRCIPLGGVRTEVGEPCNDGPDRRLGLRVLSETLPSPKR